MVWVWPPQTSISLQYLAGSVIAAISAATARAISAFLNSSTYFMVASLRSAACQHVSSHLFGPFLWRRRRELVELLLLLQGRLAPLRSRSDSRLRLRRGRRHPRRRPLEAGCRCLSRRRSRRGLVCSRNSVGPRVPWLLYLGGA